MSETNLDSKTVLDIWDLCTHCAEPGESVSLYQGLQYEANKLFKDGQEPVAAPPPAGDTVPIDHPMKKERDNGEYRIFLSPYPHGQPYPHESWASDMALVVHTKEDGSPDAFRVYRNMKEAEEKLPTADDDDFHTPEVIIEGGQPALMCLFERQYQCGPEAFDDAKRQLKGRSKSSEIEFNYAEHLRIGNSLQLKFPEGVRSGLQKLKLAEAHKFSWKESLKLKGWSPVPALMLSYGQVNGLGGDFYASYNPICRGQDFQEQCKFFMEAFNALATWDSYNEVSNILNNRQEEVDMLEDCARNHKSTVQGYASLVKPGHWYKSLKIFSQEEEDLQGMTLKRSGPSYLVAAQINFDHFGNDARTAWQAGHFCALQEAAKPNADLERAYAMNAFADHYLADCFASGHMRTPRSLLHGSLSGLKAALKSVAGLVTGVIGTAVAGMSLSKDVTNAVGPDLCAKMMHDEDNFRGLSVTRPKDGKVWKAFGDKKLLDKDDAVNEQCVIECLQADADEVYEVYKSKQLITDSSKFAAWKYMPSEAPNQGNHQPLFTPDGKLRNFDPQVMPNWPKEYCKVESGQHWDVYQALKSNEVFKKY